MRRGSSSHVASAARWQPEGSAKPQSGGSTAGETSTGAGSNKRGRQPSKDEEAHAHTDDESDSGVIPGESDRGRAFSSPAATGYGDRAEIIRRRNCENARKARARKKEEVHKLQEQVAQLKQARLASEEEAGRIRKRNARVESQRKDTVKTFLHYRCSNEKGYKEWADIVEEAFTMTLPITPYRWFSGMDVLNNNRVLYGIEHLMTDNGSLAILIESLGSGTLKWREKMENKAKGHRGVKLVCDITDDDIIITGDTMMCCFVLRTTNAVEHGAKCEWRCRGMMSAKFSPTHKLAAVEHVFDVVSLMQQLQTALGSGEKMPVVPNTPSGACQPSTEPRVITTATPPFPVVLCNESWSNLCGYSQESIQGRTLAALQGSSTDAAAVASLKSEIQRGHATSSLLMNYKHDGSKFLNYLRVYPLVGDELGNATHFLGVLQEQAEYPESESKSSDGGGDNSTKREDMPMEQEVPTKSHGSSSSSGARAVAGQRHGEKKYDGRQQAAPPPPPPPPPENIGDGRHLNDRQQQEQQRSIIPSKTPYTSNSCDGPGMMGRVSGGGTLSFTQKPSVSVTAHIVAGGTMHGGIMSGGGEYQQSSVFDPGAGDTVAGRGYRLAEVARAGAAAAAGLAATKFEASHIQLPSGVLTGQEGVEQHGRVSYTKREALQTEPVEGVTSRVLKREGSQSSPSLTKPPSRRGSKTSTSPAVENVDALSRGCAAGDSDVGDGAGAQQQQLRRPSQFPPPASCRTASPGTFSASSSIKPEGSSAEVDDGAIVGSSSTGGVNLMDDMREDERSKQHVRHSISKSGMKGTVAPAAEGGGHSKNVRSTASTLQNDEYRGTAASGGKNSSPGEDRGCSFPNGSLQPRVAEDETASLGTNNSLAGIGSTGSNGDGANPFLAWEDVLLGPGDPLEDLGEFTVEETLNQAGTRDVRGVAEGAGASGERDGSACLDGVEDARKVTANRPRSRSDPVMAATGKCRARSTLQTTSDLSSVVGGSGKETSAARDVGGRCGGASLDAAGVLGSQKKVGDCLDGKESTRSSPDGPAPWGVLPPRLRRDSTETSGFTGGVGAAGMGAGGEFQHDVNMSFGQLYPTKGVVGAGRGGTADLGPADFAARLQIESATALAGVMPRGPGLVRPVTQQTVTGERRGGGDASATGSFLGSDVSVAAGGTGAVATDPRGNGAVKAAATAAATRLDILGVGGLTPLSHPDVSRFAGGAGGGIAAMSGMLAGDWASAIGAVPPLVAGGLGMAVGGTQTSGAGGDGSYGGIPMYWNPEQSFPLPWSTLGGALGVGQGFDSIGLSGIGVGVAGEAAAVGSGSGVDVDRSEMAQACSAPPAIATAAAAVATTQQSRQEGGKHGDDIKPWQALGQDKVCCGDGVAVAVGDEVAGAESDVA